MRGWLGRPEPSARDRVRRLRERIGRLRAEGIVAHDGLHKRYGNQMAEPGGKQDLQLLGKMLQDERVPRASLHARERIGRLWDRVEALASAPPDVQEREVGTLEAATDGYEAQLRSLGAWYLTRAARTLGETQLGPDSPIRQSLDRSLSVDRDLLTVADLMIRCDLLLKVGETVAALSDATAAAARPDADHRAFAVLAATLELAKQWSDAAIAYRRAYAASDGNIDLLVKAGTAELMSGQHAEALDTAGEVLALDAENERGLDLRADALRFLGRFQEAEPIYRSLLDRPGAPDVRLGLLAVLVALERTEEVETLLTSIKMGQERSPSTVPLALYMAHRYFEAVSALLEALGDPTLPAGRRPMLERLMAAFDCAIGCPDQALDALDRMLRTPPVDGDLEDCRSIALVLLGRLEDAAESSRRSMTIAEKSEYSTSLSCVLRCAGDVAAALPHARTGHVARPGRVEATVELVCCLVQAGELQEARLLVATLPGQTSVNPHVLYAHAAFQVAVGEAEIAKRLLAKAGTIRPEYALRAVVDPVFNGGCVLDDERRARLRSLTDANEVRRVALAEQAVSLHPGDAMVIEALAKRGHIESAREVSHWLYFDKRDHADDAAAALRSDGYEVTVEHSRGSRARPWCVRAISNVVVSSHSVAVTRASMERLAARLGGEYDGWEAAAAP